MAVIIKKYETHSKLFLLVKFEVDSLAYEMWHEF